MILARGMAPPGSIIELRMAMLHRPYLNLLRSAGFKENRTRTMEAIYFKGLNDNYVNLGREHIDIDDQKEHIDIEYH